MLEKVFCEFSHTKRAYVLFFLLYFLFPFACALTVAMAASPSDLSNGDAAAAMRRQQRNRGPPVKFMLPLIYAPVLPLIRIGLRKNPVLRDRLFTAVLAGGFLHGFYLVTDLYDVESK